MSDSDSEDDALPDGWTHTNNLFVNASYVPRIMVAQRAQVDQIENLFRDGWKLDGEAWVYDELRVHSVKTAVEIHAYRSSHPAEAETFFRAWIYDGKNWKNGVDAVQYFGDAVHIQKYLTDHDFTVKRGVYEGPLGMYESFVALVTELEPGLTSLLLHQGDLVLGYLDNMEGRPKRGDLENGTYRDLFDLPRRPLKNQNTPKSRDTIRLSQTNRLFRRMIDPPHEDCMEGYGPAMYGKDPVPVRWDGRCQHWTADMLLNALRLVPGNRGKVYNTKVGTSAACRKAKRLLASGTRSAPGPSAASASGGASGGSAGWEGSVGAEIIAYLCAARHAARVPLRITKRVDLMNKEEMQRIATGVNLASACPGVELNGQTYENAPIDPRVMLAASQTTDESAVLRYIQHLQLNQRALHWSLRYANFMGTALAFALDVHQSTDRLTLNFDLEGLGLRWVCLGPNRPDWATEVADADRIAPLLGERLLHQQREDATALYPDIVFDSPDELQGLGDLLMTSVVMVHIPSSTDGAGGADTEGESYWYTPAKTVDAEATIDAIRRSTHHINEVDLVGPRRPATLDGPMSVDRVVLSRRTIDAICRLIVADPPLQTLRMTGFYGQVRNTIGGLFQSRIRNIHNCLRVASQRSPRSSIRRTRDGSMTYTIILKGRRDDSDVDRRLEFRYAP